MDPIVAATGNLHKVEELRAIFRRYGIPIIGLNDLGTGQRWREPDETGSSFEANAEIKARSYATQTGRVCLADDSGLEVDALGGAPGVISSHYCTDGRDTGMARAQRDHANNLRLLHELHDTPDGQRTARFVCVMCLAAPGRIAGTTGVLAVARGTLEGRIGRAPDVPRGANGFGYDPLFLLPLPDSRTSAELTPDEKNALSHRAAAARRLSGMIRDGLASPA